MYKFYQSYLNSSYIYKANIPTQQSINISRVSLAHTTSFGNISCIIFVTVAKNKHEIIRSDIFHILNTFR